MANGVFRPVTLRIDGQADAEFKGYTTAEKGAPLDWSNLAFGFNQAKAIMEAIKAAGGIARYYEPHAIEVGPMSRLMPLRNPHEFFIWQLDQSNTDTRVEVHETVIRIQEGAPSCTAFAVCDPKALEWSWTEAPDPLETVLEVATEAYKDAYHHGDLILPPEIVQAIQQGFEQDGVTGAVIHLTILIDGYIAIKEALEGIQ